MTRHLCAAILVLASLFSRSQCPRIYDYLGALSYTPQFINCNGSAYTVGFQSDASFGTYTVSWGDGSGDHTGASYTSGSVISHTYSAATGSYILTFTTGTCVLTGTVVNEQPALASIIVPSGVGSTLCAPKTLTFTNATTFTSTTTSYTWNFGDGSPPAVFGYTNSGQNVTHLYQKGTVNCVTQVTLMARNYCNFTPSSNSFGPLQVFDIDDAGAAADRVVRCWPDNQFNFSNTTQRNCLPQGNTSQRYERWHFGNYWGLGHDSVIGWDPWPPSPIRSVSFPAIGTYSVMLIDSNMCGTDAQVIFVNIVNAPLAGIAVPTVNICQNVPVTFTNTSSPGYQYRWNFGAGGGFVNLGAGNKTFTYNTPGTYTVQVIALIPGAGGACADTAAGVVNVMPSPTPSFVITPATACGSLAATFTDLSTGAAGWNWIFGNGNTSTLQAPPVQDYTLAGTYVATLVTTSASGCVFSSTASLLVRNIPAPAFTQANACVFAPLSFTNTSTAGGADPITSYTWNFGDNSAPSSATNAIHTYSVPSTYTVRLKASTGFCEDSVSAPVTIFVKPTASFAITPTVACPPFTANFTNLSLNATNFLWRFDATPSHTSGSTGATFTYTNFSQSLLTHTVTLVSTSPAGCSDSTSLTVQVRPKPVASYTTNTITGCSPLVTTFSSTGTPATSYDWQFGDGGIGTGSVTSHIYTNTTIFTQTVTASLVVTNSMSCTDTVSALFTIYPEALSAFSMVPQSGCAPLEVNFPSVPGVATYSWDHGDGSPTYTTLVAHNYTFANTSLSNIIYTVTLNALTSNGCLGSATGTVAVFHNPVADFTASPLAGCTPFTVTFTDGSSGDVSSTNWTFGNGTTSNNPITASTFTNGPGSGEKIYEATLVVSTPQGCQDSITRTISVYPQPKAAFTPDTPACSPKRVRFTNQSAGATSFLWSFGDNTQGTGDTISHLYINNSGVPALFESRLVAISANQCRDSVTVPVRIYTKPQFFINATPEQGCSPLTVFFPAIPGVQDYEWKYDNSISFGSTGNLYNTFENKTSVTQVFTVTMAGADSHSCRDTATQLIIVYPKPTARFSAKPLSVFIPDQPVDFTNESSSLASAFAWDFGDGGKSESRHATHTYTVAGEYHVRLIASSIHGCRDTFVLAEPVLALSESVIQVPNAFTPNPAGSKGTIFDPHDTSNDIFHPNVKGTDKYTFSIYSRWGELLFETRNPAEGWDGYYRGKICTQDVYVWKVTATFIDGANYSKTGDVLLLR
jgi:gliding motility-associated-like protein